MPIYISLGSGYSLKQAWDGAVMRIMPKLQWRLLKTCSSLKLDSRWLLSVVRFSNILSIMTENILSKSSKKKVFVLIPCCRKSQTSSQHELRLIILLTEDQSSSLLILNHKVYLDSFIRVILKKKEMDEWQNYDENNFFRVLRNIKTENI